MAQLIALVVAGVFVLFGGVVLSRASEVYERYTTIEELETESDNRIEPGRETTIRGPVYVSEPAVPDRNPLDLNGGGSPALWAWRVRQKEGTGGQGGGSRWRTVDGELAVGEFAIDHSWDRVRVDAATLPIRRDDGPTDPFDSSQCYLGDPAEDVYLGELDPVNRLLERTGLASEDGVLSDVEFTISVGGTTSMPDKYQATVVRSGDELLVRGELTETVDGYVLRGTEATPLVIAAGDLEAQRDRGRSEVHMRRVVGGALIVLGAFVAILGVL
ncbi:hypothetical protein [Natrinema halophilum]|uniref:Uncharacterized protein n=1 Tax=Natrinema halophilum TaxID=1699371 RepID=A0A7D5GLU3_9EURY|nr:hypothetical protein [Natrinema halophilum]QLG49612.1 hypothetical protein HYG82_12450 [Natrinema halophilum]